MMSTKYSNNNCELLLKCLKLAVKEFVAKSFYKSNFSPIWNPNIHVTWKDLNIIDEEIEGVLIKI